ncbi:LysM peptidoglycan-binding domain-containing protein [Streptomyces chiangmaiensis]|uniref:Transglycosylase family protein n=1 Tax=Streptomyces chiangmaiensis TaxID=766497 RepID=A0ABU7FAW2_9ACTN|nr:transglycosylase family protein [Streptomyces chiangmaiensis]MED7821218.1 transglycosylase family protein [Streptomyces chiangmaiensis]
MLSGNGRHRRPRQAPALLVAAGVTGSAIAIPLLGATGASASDATTWDQVAQCESDGSWSADTGNGHYGGLQLTQRDWEKYGGLDYAPSADQASRSQQIAVAERILDDRGVSVWSACGLVAGLNEDSGSADVDTGVAGESSGRGSSSGFGLDSGLSDSSGTSASAKPSLSFGASHDSADHGAGAKHSQSAGGPSAAAMKGDESDKSGQSDASSGGGADETSGFGRHRGGSAGEGDADGRTGDSIGRHASRDSRAARDAADGSYTVRPGDNLSGIADSLDLTGGWRALYDVNKRTVGADPDHILPGQSLALDADPHAGKR